MTILEQIFTWTLRASWHASILVVVVILIQQLFRKQLTATWRHALWFAVLIRLAIPFMPSSSISPLNIAPQIQEEAIPLAIYQQDSFPIEVDQPISVPSMEPSPLPSEPQKAAIPTSTNHIPKESFPEIEIYQGIALLWGVGVLLLLTRLFVQNIRFRQRLSSLPPGLDDVSIHTLQKAATSLKMQPQHLSLIKVPEIKSPCIYGLFRPSLLLPSDLHSRLTKEELECVFLHELAHIKRGDPMTNWIMNLLICVHWFNPVIWFAMRQLQADRELATDTRVLETVDEDRRQVYGETIVRLLETLNHHSPPLVGTVGIVEGKRMIRDRITRIAAYSRSHKTPKLALALTVGLIAVFMLDAQNQDRVPSTENPNGGTLAIREFPPITIAVMDADSKAPITDSRVTIQTLWWDASTSVRDLRVQNVVTLTTDLLGLTTATKISHDTDRIHLDISHEDYPSVSRSISLNQEALPPRIEVLLKAGTEIGGLVTDLNQVPVEGVRVEIQFNQRRSDPFVSTADEAVTTDIKGRWTYSWVPKDINQVRLSFQHSQFALPAEAFTRGLSNATFSPRSISESAAILSEKQHHVMLAPVAELYGRVLDHKGAPLQGAKLTTLGGGSENIISDSDGQFRFESIFMGTPTGTFKLLVVAAGHSPRILDVEASKGLEPQEIQLEAGNKLHLRFIDLKGNPVAKVRIVPKKWAGQQHNFFTRDHFSDEDGSFTWTDAPRDAVEFAFSKIGYRHIQSHPLTTQETPYTITIEPELKLTFNVTDETRQPIPAFIVDHGQPRETEQGVRSIYWSKNRGGRGLNGTLEIAERYPVVHGTQFKRSYYYRIEADGYRSFITREITADEGQVTLTVTLQKVENPVSTLQLPSGAPLPNSHLWLLEPRGSVRLTEQFEVFSGNSTVIDTDSRGQFTLPQRKGNDFLFTSLPEGFLLVRRSHTSPFIVQPWGSIKGTWYEKGIPTSGRTLGLQLTRGTWGSSPPSFSFRFQVTTNEKGEFEFPKVPPVELELLHWISSGNGRSLGRFVQTISMDPGDEKQLIVQQPSIHKITGQIQIPESLLDQINFTRYFAMVLPIQSPPPAPVDIQGEPEKFREWFQHWAQTTQEGKAYHKLRRQGTSIFIDPDGRFQAAGLVPGEYQAQISFTERGAPELVPHVRKMVATANFKIEITEDSPLQIEMGEFPVKISMH